MLWLKALHLIFMVTWFAGLFYLPRLFVYHAMSEDKISNERFKVMERKLYYGIMTPGMILTFVFGIWMLDSYAWALYGKSGWLHVKLVLLGILFIYHLVCGNWLLQFKYDRNPNSHVFYRWINEIPVVFLFAIIILAVVKPDFNW
jgi:putative membrane protein